MLNLYLFNEKVTLKIRKYRIYRFKNLDTTWYIK